VERLFRSRVVESAILVLIWRFMLTSLRGGGCGTSYQDQGRRMLLLKVIVMLTDAAYRYVTSSF
jgi:hypothetical protein